MHIGDTAGVARLDKAIADARNSALSWAADRIKRMQDPAYAGSLNYGANISELQGFQNVLFKQQDAQSEEARHSQDEAALARQKAADDLKAAQKRLAEQYKQAQEVIVAQWRRDLDEARADGDMTPRARGPVLGAPHRGLARGSLSYIAAVDEANKTIARMRQQNMTQQKGIRCYLDRVLPSGQYGPGPRLKRHETAGPRRGRLAAHRQPGHRDSAPERRRAQRNEYRPGGSHAQDHATRCRAANGQASHRGI